MTRSTSAAKTLDVSNMAIIVEVYFFMIVWCCLTPHSAAGWQGSFGVEVVEFMTVGSSDLLALLFFICFVSDLNLRPVD